MCGTLRPAGLAVGSEVAEVFRRYPFYDVSGRLGGKFLATELSLATNRAEVSTI